jgi:hypothetical protein
MPATHDLWGNPIPEDPPPAPKPKYKKRRQFANQLPTDILVWLRQNEPGTFEELMDLRLALYSRQTKGQYQISHRGQTMMGEEKYVVVGPAGPLLLLSEKARHFLLRNLCRLRRRKGWPPIRY